MIRKFCFVCLKNFHLLKIKQNKLPNYILTIKFKKILLCNSIQYVMSINVYREYFQKNLKLILEYMLQVHNTNTSTIFLFFEVEMYLLIKKKYLL